MSRNSSTDWRAACAGALWTFTTIPGATGVAHEAASFGCFSISTRHMRHTPATGRPGW